MTEPFWFHGENSIVLFSAINITRNINKTLFPLKSSLNQKESTLSFLLDVVKTLTSVSYHDYHDISSMSKIIYKTFQERHILPKKMPYAEFSCLCVTEGEDSSVILNSKDHISLRVCRGDFDLYALYEKIENIENEIGENIDFAFDESFGYLSSSLKNIGCGVKANIALSVPMLSFFGRNYLENFYLECGSLGYSALNENGKKPSKTDFIIIRNKTSFGMSESDIFEGIHYLASTLMETEIKMRDRFYKTHRSFIEDKVFRSYSIIMSAKLISYSELKRIVSWLRLGQYYKIIDIDLYSLNKMLIYLKDAHIENIYSQVRERNEARALYGRDILKNSI